VRSATSDPDPARSEDRDGGGSEGPRPALVGTQPRNRLPLLYARSAWWSLVRRDPFDQVEAFCLFLGYPRSGHSLVGSLIDAHPDVVLAHELDSLRLVRLGFRRRQLFSLILANERSFTEAGREWTGSDYRVLDGWQGRYRRLRVIGDKKGGQSTRRLRAHPGSLDRLRRTVNLPLRVIHVVRDPLDNVASMSLRREIPIEAVAEDYFGLCDAIDRLIDRFPPHEWTTVRYETLVQQPQQLLRHLCEFLGVETDPAYLRAASAVPRPQAARTRDRVSWPPHLVDTIERRTRDHPHLASPSPGSHQARPGEVQDGERLT